MYFAHKRLSDVGVHLLDELDAAHRDARTLFIISVALSSDFRIWGFVQTFGDDAHHIRSIRYNYNHAADLVVLYRIRHRLEVSFPSGHS